MDLAAGMARGIGRAGRTLALVAALFLAFCPHLVQAGTGGGSQSAGPDCIAQHEPPPSSDQGSDHGQDLSGGHGDCLHHGSVLLALPQDFRQAFRLVTHLPPAAAALSDLKLTADPPPPRRPS